MKEWTGAVVVDGCGVRFEATVYIYPPGDLSPKGSWEGQAVLDPVDAFKFLAQSNNISTNIGEILITDVKMNGLIEFKGSGPPRGPIAQ